MDQETTATAAAAQKGAGEIKMRNGAKFMNAGEEDQIYTEEQKRQLLALYEGNLGTISEGEIVQGRIVAIGESDVSIDIGFKSEGLVSLHGVPQALNGLKIGDQVEVFLESVENKDGQMVLVPQTGRLHARVGTDHEIVREGRDCPGQVHATHQGWHCGRPHGYRRVPPRVAD